MRRRACRRRRRSKASRIDALLLAAAPDVGSLVLDALDAGRSRCARGVEAFVAKGRPTTPTARDRPPIDGTSRLSPHLHFGEVSIRARRTRRSRSATAPKARASPTCGNCSGASSRTTCCIISRARRTHNLDPRFDDFDWATPSTRATARRGKRGHTGIPIVDAGMRQLWQTGWMHNRVRMLVASFLTKHLRVHWIEGARWFWDTLVDADLANNTLGLAMGRGHRRRCRALLPHLQSGAAGESASIPTARTCGGGCRKSVRRITRRRSSIWRPRAKPHSRPTSAR